MSEKFTLTISEQLKRDLEQFAGRSGHLQSAIVWMAFQKYLYIRQFSDLRNQFLAQDADQGICSDEDVFERVS